MVKRSNGLRGDLPGLLIRWSLVRAQHDPPIKSIVSPDDMNDALPRVIVAPITSKGQPPGCRPELTFQDRPARILLDQEAGRRVSWGAPRRYLLRQTISCDVGPLA